MLWIKGIGGLVVLLMVFAAKSSYNARVFTFVAIAGGLLYLALNKKR